MVELNVALKVIEEIEQHGYKAYIVGGMVRNHLLGIPSNDVDITTNATPMEIKDIFTEAEPSEDYGAVTVTLKGIKYEITTFRREDSYLDHRRPSKIEYIDDLEEDLKRRDFTINTMCMDSKGNIIDYLGGQDDLDARIIRSVGDADKKFNEDALRMLRAVRFAAILDFDLDKEVVEAIEKNKHFLRDLSYQRKKEELDKIFSSPNSSKGLKLLDDLGLDDELEIHNLSKVGSVNSSIGIWSVLDYADKYPFSSNEKELIKSIRCAVEQNNLDPMTLYKYGLYANSVAGSIKNIDIKDITESYNNLVIHGRKELNITSDEIMNLLNREPGEYMSEIYKDIEHAVLYKTLSNTREDILAYINSNYKD